MSMDKHWFIYIPDELVRKNISVTEVIRIVEEVYRAHGNKDAWLSEPSAQFLKEGKGQITSYKVKGASIPSKGVSGFRIIGNTIVKTERDPWTYRYCYLADPLTARPLAIIDEYYQSALRTGVTGAVALSLLGKKDSRIVGMVGAGNIARHFLEALTHFFSLKEIRVNSRSKVAQKSFCREMSDLLGIPVHPVASPELAVKGADLVVTITDADTILVSTGWLSKGATLCSMGNNQELDPKILNEVDKCFVDDFDFCRAVGDVHAWISKGDLTEAEIAGKVHGTLPEVITRRKRGRENTDEKILAVVQGMASCDLAIACLVYEKLKESEEVQRIAI